MTDRTIVVGDVHGCLDELQDLIGEVGFARGSDRLIFVGDLINKGPDSRGVLDYVKSLKAEVVVGNHEDYFLRLLQGEEEASPSWQDVLRQTRPNQKEYRRWIESWPTYIETEDFVVVHAGLHPEKAPVETPRRILTTIRTWDGVGEDLNNPFDPAWYDLYRGDKLVVFGHWAFRGLIETPKVIGLDSGCVYGHRLSAVVLPERRIVSVPSHQVYVKPKMRRSKVVAP